MVLSQHWLIVTTSPLGLGCEDCHLMKLLYSIEDVRAFTQSARNRGLKIGFVPTMGFLHSGHLALMRLAGEWADVVVASLFVNPTQFGPNEDYDSYPRDVTGDLEKARSVGCDGVFLPDLKTMYPDGSVTHVSVGQLTGRLCGSSRPGHFDGVTTVVLKLLNIVESDIAVFGEKDYQQLAVIRQMVRDLNLAVTIIGHPIVREPDGLAMSSRNSYLSPTERTQARVLSTGLKKANVAWQNGLRDAASLRDLVQKKISDSNLARIDYVEVCDAESLAPIQGECVRSTLIAVAVFFGETRLIDNCLLDPQSQVS